MLKKGEFNIIGMLSGILLIGLFFGVIAYSIESLEGGYDTSDFDKEDLKGFLLINNSDGSFVKGIESQANIIDSTVVDPNWFDILAGLFKKLTAPFRFIYNTFKSITIMTSIAVSKLELIPIFKEFFATIITILVVIGAVMMKHYFGRQS